MSRKSTDDDRIRDAIQRGSRTAHNILEALEHEVRSGEYGQESVPCADSIARCRRLLTEIFRTLEAADTRALEQAIEGEARAFRDEIVLLFRSHVMPTATVTALEERIAQLENELTAPGNELRTRLIAVVLAEIVAPLTAIDKSATVLLDAVMSGAQSLRDLRSFISGSAGGTNGLLPALFALYDRFVPFETDALERLSRGDLDRELAAIIEASEKLGRDCLSFKELRDGFGKQLAEYAGENTRIRTALGNAHRAREVWNHVCGSLGLELTSLVPEARQAAARALGLTDRLQRAQQELSESNTLARACDDLFRRCDDLFTKIRERIATLGRRAAFDFSKGTSKRDQELTKALVVALYRSAQDVKKPSRSTKSLARAVIAARLADPSDEPLLITLARSVDAVMGISPLRNPDLRQLTTEGQYFAARWEHELTAPVSDALAGYWRPSGTPLPPTSPPLPPPAPVEPDPISAVPDSPAIAAPDAEPAAASESTTETALLVALQIWNRGNVGLERNAAPLYASLVISGWIASGSEQRFNRAVRSLSASGKIVFRSEQRPGKPPVLLLRLTERGAERSRALQESRSQRDLEALGRICRQEFPDTRTRDRWEVQRAAAAEATHE